MKDTLPYTLAYNAQRHCGKTSFQTTLPCPHTVPVERLLLPLKWYDASLILWNWPLLSSEWFMFENKSRPFRSDGCCRRKKRMNVSECVHRASLTFLTAALIFESTSVLFWNSSTTSPSSCVRYSTHGIFQGQDRRRDRPTDQTGPKEVCTLHTHRQNHFLAVWRSRRRMAMMMVIYGELWDICLLSEKFDEYIKELGCLMRMPLNHSMWIKVAWISTDWQLFVNMEV